MPELHLKYLRGVALALYDRVVLLDPRADTSKCLFERPARNARPTLVVIVQDIENTVLTEYVKIELDPLNLEAGWKI
ncbi:hypothetical protein PV762_23410 [Mitsuaria sp. CC2]|jgi:hypothetical protein|uniref:hypothetical protein n=1 Tax=Mitsuaria sp. CC2 TaxID=3029186 RepID=UPI00121C9731|nr:MAG: hypothetical protein EOP37_09540 [Rubrivivax sp.]